TSEPIKVVVGTSKTTYFVNEARLRASSDFFSKVFDGHWKESTARTVTLPEIMPTAFSIYDKWPYTGYFYTTGSNCLIYDEWLDEYRKEEYITFGECYQLADYLQATDFKDACIDSLIHKTLFDKEIPYGIATNMYPHTLESRPIVNSPFTAPSNFGQTKPLSSSMNRDFPRSSKTT
ncbi:hypothetical protein COCMIDRAFT_95041, partial [Bipolaris oryzae ATCC 44560]